MIGKIIKNISDTFTVANGDKLYNCKARGNFRYHGITPLVGDNVDFNETELIIENIHKRKNELVRPSVSNMDQVLIITSVLEPVFSSNLLDKLLVIIEYNNIKPIICFTKLDLVDNKSIKEINRVMKYYRSIGYKVITNLKLKKIKFLLKNKVTIVAGQSGVGKSTLLNKLDKRLNLNTNKISLALGRGKHTTRHTELFKINGGLIADTPGFSALNFDLMSVEDIRDNFIEFNKYKSKCEFDNCMHLEELNCEIKRQIANKKIAESRYKNYLKFVKKK